MPAGEAASGAGGVEENEADVSISQLTAIRGLDKTDVKIALNFRGLSFHLDVLMVQIGPVGVLKPVLLNITIHPCYAPTYVGTQRLRRIGRGRLDPDLASDYNFRIARRWLWGCVENHESCSSKKESILPTRVIKINFPNASRLIISNGAKGEYGTLSHCWGGEVSAVLTTKTMKEFEKKIKHEDLPVNFRDAIEIAWQLGLKYLWIDSLCILQDSKEDWESESEKMAAIYRNSTVTIAALTSSGTKEGILKGRGQNLKDQNRPKLRLSKSCGYGEHETVMLDCQSVEKADVWELTEDAPLRRRAWTLQETHLSPRVLYYGTHQLYFHCPKGMESSEGVSGLNNGVDDIIGQLSINAIYPLMHGAPPTLGPSSIELIRTEYYNLVKDYTTRKLTFDSDKLPAFSGIAQSFHPFLGGEYLAGIWSSDLTRGLLRTKGASVVRHVRQPYRAPSWSWLVTNEPVSFYSARSTQGSREVELVGQYIEPKNTQNPYGEINLGSLTLTGLTKRLVVSTAPRQQSLPENWVASFSFDESGGRQQVCRVTNGDVDYLLAVTTAGSISQNLKDEQEKYKEYVILLVRSTRVPIYRRHAPMSEVSLDAWFTGECLLLEKTPLSTEETFERVGRLDFDYDRFYHETWETRTLKLV